MFIRKALEQFNPIMDEIPRFMHDLEFIARRASLILQDWDETQILAVAEKLDWIFYEFNRGFGDPEFKPSLPALDETTSDWLQYFLDSPVAELYERRHQIDISQVEAATNAAWSDYFAVLSLAYIAQAATAYKAFMNRDKAPKREATEAFNINKDKILAREAITYAEFIVELKQQTENLDATIEVEARNQLRQRNIHAMKQRHADIKALKQRFIDYYYTETFPSKQNAAEQFYTGLTDDEKRLLAPTNAVRTLTDVLGDYERRHSQDRPSK